MEREEAIAVLKEEWRINAEIFGKQFDEALGMAFKALEQEPCEDAISRQAAIDAINKIAPVDTEYDCTLLDRVDVRYVLNELPSIQPDKDKETATVSVGISKGGVTMWYECDACGEPVDQGDTFCSGCGRRLIHE